MIYNKFVGGEAFKHRLIPDLRNQAEKGTLIIYEDEDSAHFNDPQKWKELSKVEVLIALGTGKTKIFHFSKEAETWVEIEL